MHKTQNPVKTFRPERLYVYSIKTQSAVDVTFSHEEGGGGKGKG